VNVLLGGGLWRSPDFLKLWSGQSISELGTAVTNLALPLAAISVLQAGPFQVGLLAALQTLAYPLLGVVAGVWVDRLPRRPILIVCDLGRMLVLGSVPASYFALHELSMTHLYVAALLLGTFTVFFDITYQSYLPSLVSRSALLEGNSKLLASRSVAQVAGPALAGVLINLLTAPIAILADSMSYVVSVLTLVWIRRPETHRGPGRGARAGFLRELREGARAVFGLATIRLVTAANATANLGAAVVEAVFLIFAYNQLRLSPATIGWLYAAGAVAAVLGATTGPRLAARLGLGPLMTATALFYRATYLLLPLIALIGAPIYVLGAVLVTSRYSELIYQVAQLSLRQSLIPSRLQGRANAVARTIAWSAIPLGSALGGVLGVRIGLLPTIVVGALLSMMAALWILAGPVRLREQPMTDPEPPEEETKPAGRLPEHDSRQKLEAERQ
jgi:predicted MFS family arabinose efflux permease